jgi:anti-sigma regulatory factor (Ser/Thr protein kinase)
MQRTATRDGESFRHEALFYAGEPEFRRRVGSFVAGAVEAGEPILVVLPAPKIDLLRVELADVAAGVEFADMADVGRNPACIIPAWRDFVDRQVDRGPFRGVGEPVWAGRSVDELAECRRHEALLNVAFEGSPPWSLLCPYDAAALPGSVLEDARTTHPFVRDGDATAASGSYLGNARAALPDDRALPEPPEGGPETRFRDGDLPAVRHLVAARAEAFGLRPERRDDLVLAVSEVAANSIRHGGGKGTLRSWAFGDSLICEVRDRGRIDDPLVGRRRPHDVATEGSGLWIANRLCDLVQIRSQPTGSVIRLHMSRASEAAAP